MRYRCDVHATRLHVSSMRDRLMVPWCETVNPPPHPTVSLSPTGQFPPLFPRDGKVKYSKWYHSMQPNSWFDEHPGMQYQHQYLPYRCMPPTARDYDCQDNKKAVVARIADAVARNESFRAVHFPPFQRTTQELYDIHFGSADCTHFCYMPGFIEAGIHLINEAIAAAASSESAVGGATGEV